MRCRAWCAGLLACLFMAGTAGAQVPDEPVPVESVDLERYAGLWYEIARIPNRFQNDCVGAATAYYELREDGRLEVENRCVKENGKVKQAGGVGRYQEDGSAKLEVSFFSIIGWRPIWGDYWILDLGEQYEHAIVGDRNRKYGWILSRSRLVSPQKLDLLFDRIRAQGYDPDEFVLVQPDPEA